MRPTDGALVVIADSREVVIAALSGERPDRVPVVEFLIDPAVAWAVAPGCADVADAMDRLGLDAVACGARFATIRKFPDGSYEDEWGVIEGLWAQFDRRHRCR